MWYIIYIWWKVFNFLWKKTLDLIKIIKISIQKINNTDIKTGQFTSYYHNGSLQSDLKYSNNSLSGTCSWYFPSGNLMRIKDYLIETVYQIEYYENGSKKSEGSFKGSKLTGRWIFYDKNGDLSSEEDY